MKMRLATLTEGQRFKLLVEDSKIQKQEIAERLKIIPGSLSRIFRREKLSDEMRKAAAELFDVPESYFSGETDKVAETPPGYKTSREIELEQKVAVLEDELEAMRQRLIKANMEKEAALLGQLTKKS